MIRYWKANQRFLNWIHINLKSGKIFKGILLILPAHLNKEVIMIIVLIHCKTMLENSLKIKLQPSALAFNIVSLTVPNIIAVSNKTVSWTCPISSVIPVSFNLLPNCLVIAPKEPTTDCIIFTLTFQIFCNSLLRSWYFSVFSFSFSSILLS